MRTCPKCGEAMEDQFDSCWKCAPKQPAPAMPRRRLNLSDYIMAALIAYLIPWLAICVQSSTEQYGWWYTSPLSHIDATMFL